MKHTKKVQALALIALISLPLIGCESKKDTSKPQVSTETKKDDITPKKDLNKPSKPNEYTPTKEEYEEAKKEEAKQTSKDDDVKEKVLNINSKEHISKVRRIIKETTTLSMKQGGKDLSVKTTTTSVIDPKSDTQSITQEVEGKKQTNTFTKKKDKVEVNVFKNGKKEKTYDESVEQSGYAQILTSGAIEEGDKDYEVVSKSNNGDTKLKTKYKITDKLLDRLVKDEVEDNAPSKEKAEAKKAIKARLEAYNKADNYIVVDKYYRVIKVVEHEEPAIGPKRLVVLDYKYM